jgi:tetratricopeptide (TPR) repeat protein
MTTLRKTAGSSAGNTLLLAWINRALECLWLVAAVLIPIAFIDRNYAVSEAVIAYVEVPKIAILRTVAGLMSILWLLEWGIKERPVPARSFAWIPSKIWASSLWFGVSAWLKGHPHRWLLLSVWVFLGSTLLTTALSGSFQTSLWGEIPGQDGYAAYTVVSYVLLFAVIATHLKTRSQMGRLVAALVVTGVLVGGYAVLQHYGRDFLDLTEQTGGGQLRATSFMGNAIFCASVMSMTIPITLMASVVTFTEPAALSRNLAHGFKQWLRDFGITGGWGVALAVQLLGIAFTLSRGPWLGTILSLAAFLGLCLLFVGWRSFSRGALVLGLAAVLTIAFLQWQGSLSNLGPERWPGILLFLAGFTVIGVIHLNWRRLGLPILLLSAGLLVVGAVILGPSGLAGIGGVIGNESDPSDAPSSDTASELGERFSSIGTEVLSGGRSTHWRVSWILIRERPWFAFDELHLRWLRPLIGYGPDLFRYTYLLESPAEGPENNPLEPDNAHNYFIHQTVDQGLLGLVSSLGIFASVFLAGAYLLLGKTKEPSALYNVLVIGLLATLAGRFLEMTVGVARVSDLTMLWTILALFATLPAVMRNSRDRERMDPSSISRIRDRPQDLRRFWRMALVGVLIGGIGMLSWVKSVNYVRAAVAEGQAVQHFLGGDSQEALISLDRAIVLAPDVPTYHTNRGTLYMAYLSDKTTTPERGCSQPKSPPYDVCLATESFRSNLIGASKRPFYYRARLSSAHAALLFPLDAEAIRLYTETLSLLPNSWNIRNQLAETYLQAGMPEAALQHLLDSIDITGVNSQSADALYLLGVAYRDLDRPEQAAETLERALAFNPGRRLVADSLDILAKYYTDLGTEATLDRLNGILIFNPEDSVAHYHRGQVYAQMGLFDEALEEFNRSLDLGFVSAELFAWRGRMAGHVGQEDKAKSDLKQAVYLDPASAENLAYLGDFQRANGEFTLAGKTIEQALRLDSQLGLAYQFRGLLRNDLGLFEEAIQDFDHAIGLDPGLAGALSGRTEAASQRQLLAETGLATQAFDDLRGLYSTELSEAQLFAWRGRMAQHLGRYDDAASYFRTAVVLDPENAEQLAFFGDSDRMGGAMYLAAYHLDRAIQLDPKMAIAYHFRGLLKYDLGLSREAIRDFDRAISLDPGLAAAFISRAEAYLQEELFSGTGLADQTFEDLSASYSLEFHEEEFFAWRGRMAQHLGRYDDAASYFKSAVALDPQNAEYSAYLGDLYRSVGMFYLAAQVLDKAIRLDPQLPEAYQFRGLLLNDMGLFEEAILDFDRAINLDPGVANASSSRTEASRQQELLAEAGLTTQAFDDVRRLYSAEFSEAGLFAWRGRMAQHLGREEDAVSYLSRSVELAPQNAEYSAYLGDLYRSVGMFNLAAQVLDKAIRLDPQLPEAYQFRGLLLNDMGLFEEAILDFDRAINLDPGVANASSSRTEASRQQELLAEAGLTTQAFDDVRRLYSAEFSEAGLFAWRGRMAQHLGREEDAVSYLSRSVELAPQNAEYSAYLGDLYRSVGMFNLAAQVLDKAIRLDPQLPEAYQFRGRILHSTDQYLQAIEDFSRAIELKPGLAEVYRDRGRTYIVMGRYELALQDLEMAIDRDPFLSEARLLRARAYLKLDQYEEAVIDLNQAINLSPQLSEAYALRGRALLALGRDREAAQDLEQAEQLNSG